jgi:peptidoglycan/xylan/chitin deacetylase (PgdA/CDA1 family)
MPRHIVCLTFDHDHMSGFIARGLTTPTYISRGEYDMVVIPRLVALLGRYDIKATFFTPGHTIDSSPQSVMPYVEAGHELAHHGWTHRLPASLSRDEEEEEIVRGNNSIKRVSGQVARGYRSPAWDLSPHSIELLLKHRIKYDSSLMGHDYDCYYARQGDVVELKKPFQRGRETALLEMPISWSLDDYPHFEFVRTPTTVLPGLQSARTVMETWRDEFRYMQQTVEWGVLTYTMHPYVIGRGYRMLALAAFVQDLAAAGAVFMTMRDAAAEAQTRMFSK